MKRKKIISIADLFQLVLCFIMCFVYANIFGVDGGYSLSFIGLIVSGVTALVKVGMKDKAKINAKVDEAAARYDLALANANEKKASMFNSSAAFTNNIIDTELSGNRQMLQPEGGPNNNIIFILLGVIVLVLFIFKRK